VAENGHRPLTAAERRVVRLLGLPTFGLALAITVVSTYLPVLARDFGSSTTIIGLIIGGEGLMALWLPLVAGTWSDRLERRYRRLPFVVGATPIAALALAFMGFAPSLAVVAVLVLFFFAAYYVAYEPYRALYPDLLGDGVAGRSQGNQAVWRGGGTLLALVGGGLLFSAGKELPFLAGGVILALAIGGFAFGMVRFGPRPKRHETDGEAGDAAREVRDLIRREKPLRLFLAANALWELSLAALKTFVVLYITDGLGKSLGSAAGAIGAVAVFVVLGALISGRLADRTDTGRVMHVALWVYGLGLLVPLFAGTHTLFVLITAPVIAAGGGVLMTLPFALLMPLMPKGHHGALTGYYSLSRGIGITLGPILAGAAISLGGPLFESTHGYAAMWFVCSASILASIPLLRALQRERRS
jgi:MFS family permease